MLEEFTVGVILRPHGVHGEVKVIVLSDDPRRLEQLSEVKVCGPRTEGVLTVQNVRYSKGLAIVKFKELSTMDDTAPYLRAEIRIPRAEAFPLGEGEYYTGDLIGCRVLTEDGSRLGTLREVLETGANDVYEVETEDGTVLLPAIRECILSVDVEKQEIVVHLMKGLV